VTNTTNWTFPGSDDWDDPSAWDNGVPTSSSDAVIDADAPDVNSPGLTVTFDAGSNSFNSTTTAESADSLTMNDATLEVDSGTLSLETSSTLYGVSLTGGVLDFANSDNGDDGYSAITGTLSQTAGTLEIDAGTLDVQGYATFDGSPSIDLANGSVLLISGSADLGSDNGFGGGGAAAVRAEPLDPLYLYGSGTLVDDGTFTQSAYVALEADGNADGTSITIDTGAAWYLDTTGDPEIYDDGPFEGTLGIVNNAGLFETTGTGDGEYEIDPTFINTGTISVQSGTLYFGGSNDVFGGTLTGPGEIDIVGVGATLEAGVDLDGLGSLAVGNQITLDGPLSFAGNFDLSYGTLDLNGNDLDLTGPASFEGLVAGPGEITVSDGLIDEAADFGGGVTLEDAGSIAQTSTFYLAEQFFGDTGTIDVDAGTTWDITGDYAIDSYGGGVINNSGLFEKTGGDALSFIEADLNSTGTVDVGSGFYLAGTASNSFGGVLEGSLLDIAGPTTFETGLTLDIGTIEILPGGYLTLDDSLVYGGSFFAGNGGPTVLDLNGNDLSLTGPATFAAGAGIEGPGTLTVDGTAVVGGELDVVLYNGATLADEGTVLQEGSIYLGGSAADSNTITIDLGLHTATWDLDGDFGIGGQGTADVLNGSHGLFEKTAGEDTSTIGVDFVSSGTVLAETGTIAFEGAQNSFTGTLEGPAEIDLGVGTFTLGLDLVIDVGTLGIYGFNTNSTDIILDGNIVYAGDFTIGNVNYPLDGSTNLNLNGYNAAFTGLANLDGGIEGPGTVTVDDGTADGLFLYNGAVLVDAGLVTQSNGIQFGASAGDTATLTIEYGATWDIIGNSNSSNGIAQDGQAVINNSGLFEKTEDGAQANIAADIDNTGIVLADRGTLNFLGAVTNAGTLLAENGGAIVDQTGLSGGSGDVDIGNNGTVEFVSTVSAGQTIDFTGATGDLVLYDPNGVSAAINGFAFGDTIDLAGIVANGFSYVGDMLTLTDTVNGTIVDAYTLDVPDISDASALTLVDDNGIDDETVGTDIVLNHTGPAFTTPTGTIYPSSWASDVDGDWSNGSNWQTTTSSSPPPAAIVPGTDDDVYLQPADNGSNPFTVTYDTTDTVNQLNAVTFATFDITGGELTVNEGGSFGGNLEQTGGTLDAVSGLSFGPTDLGSAAVDEVDSRGLAIAGAGVAGGAWGTLAGLVEGEGNFYLEGGYIFTLDPGFTITTGTFELGVNGDGYGSYTYLDTNVSYDGAFDLDNYSGNNAILFLNGNTFDLAVGGTGTLQGDISGPGEFIVAGSVSGGAAGYGGLYTTNGATLLDAGTITEAFNGATIGGLLSIESGATYNIVDDNGINASSGTIDNTGLFEKTGGLGFSSISGDFSTTATLAVDSGTLQLVYGSDTLGGVISGPGTLELTDSAFAIETGLSVTVSSLIENDSSDILLGANTLTLSGNDALNAYVDGTGAVDSSGTLNVNGLVLGGGATLDNTGTVTQAGYLTLGDSLNPVEEVINAAGGTWELQANDGFNAVHIANYEPGGNEESSSFFLNQGLLEEIGGNSPVLITSGFTNALTGTIDIGTGGIDFLEPFAPLYGPLPSQTLSGLIEGPGGLTLENSVTFDAGLTLDVASVALLSDDTYVTIDLAESLSYAGTFDAAAGTIELGGDTLTLSGPSDLNGGLIGSGAVASSAQLNVDGLNIANGVTLDNTGSITQGSYVYLGTGAAGTAEIDNEAGGTYDIVDPFTQITPFGGAEFVNAGLLESTGGVTQPVPNDQAMPGVTIGVTLDNTGTVEITAGSVDFSARTFTNDGLVTIDNASATLDNIVGTGTIDLTNSYLLISGTVDAGEQIYSDPSTIDIADVADFQGTLYPSGGDTIIFEGADGGSYGDGVFTLTSDGFVIGTIAAPGYSSDDFSFTTNNGTLEAQDTQTPCYCRGTLIRTGNGEVPVERLRIGDRVITEGGAARPIKWIGRRAYDPRFVRGKRSVLPIVLSADALGDGIPTRDLWVSPEHALYLDGVLVPAKLLVNGLTIVQLAAVDRLEYFHIELDSHDVIFADGAPAETYIECDNRSIFHNAGEFTALYPEGSRDADKPFAWRVEEGDSPVAAIRERLLARAAVLGHRLTDDPGVHLVADGVVVAPSAIADGVYRFTLAQPPRSAFLASRSTVPAETDAGATDRRRLGVSVHQITLRDADFTLDLVPDHHLLRDGFHEAEGVHRWTDGMARLPTTVLDLFAGPLDIEIALWPSQLRYVENPAYGVSLLNSASPPALRLAG
jgi:hypothetical protein